MYLGFMVSIITFVQRLPTGERLVYLTKFEHRVISVNSLVQLSLAFQATSQPVIRNAELIV